MAQAYRRPDARVKTANSLGAVGAGDCSRGVRRCTDGFTPTRLLSMWPPDPWGRHWLFIDDFVPSDAVKQDFVGFKKLEYDADVARHGKSPEIFQSA